jgi:3-oxoacyl-[acyl-carrier protein] reductase
MLKRFDGKWVLVTGAAGGMGRAFASAFAAEGASLALTDVSVAGLAEAADELSAQGTRCFTHAADLSVEEETLRLASVVSEHCSQLDALINNAGLAYGEIARAFETLSQSQWLHYFAVNTVAPLRLAQSLRAHLARARGVVLNVSSMASYVPGTAYGVTKAALNAMTYGMASAFGADGIRVNAIAPGIMDTPAAMSSLPPGTFERIQSQQMLNLRGDAQDIAALALFLASDAARFVTCEVISCDAGNRVRGWR